MLVTARAKVHVTVKGLSFTAEDTFTNRLATGEYGQVLIDTVSVTMYRLNDTKPEQYWCQGFRLRQDGSVGSRRASQVLLDAGRIPTDVLAAIRQAYITQIRHLSTEDGMNAPLSH